MEKKSWFTAFVSAVLMAISAFIGANEISAMLMVIFVFFGAMETSAADYGETWTYVQIDLSDQWLLVVQGDEVVYEAPVVTGTAGTSRATPTGYFYIYSKETCRTLRGDNYSAYVDYWMPFNGGIGIHDATWRSEDEFAYGGETYLWNGSHGCINMRYDDAATVYSLVSVGDVVIVTE